MAEEDERDTSSGEEYTDSSDEETASTSSGEHTDPETLRLWYTNLLPRTVDIVGDFAGRELFVIHGEGLLRHCITEAKVDFQDGMQLLHAVYVVEKFLDELRQRGCNFDILFFNAHANTVLPESVAAENASMATAKFALARTVLIEHLKRHARNGGNASDRRTNVTVFDDLDSEDFRRYRAENAVHFFLCNEGTSYGENDESVGAGRTVVLRHFIYRLVSEGYHVAVINDVQFMSSKIFTTLISGSNTRLADLDLPEGIKTPLVEQNIAGESADRLTVRELVVIAALKQILQSGNYGSEAAALLLHTALLGASSLSERLCGNASKALAGTQASFLDNFFRTARDIIKGLSQDASLDNLTWDIYDLVDVLTRANLLRKALAEATDDSKVSSIPQYDEDEDDEEGAKESSTQDRDTSVLPFSHPVFDKHLDSVQARPDARSSKSTTAASIFEELSHWNKDKKPVDPRKPPPKLGFWAKKRHQKLMADIVTYSASLTNATGRIIDPEVVVSGTGNQAKVAKQVEKAKKVGGGKAKALAAAKALQASKHEKKGNTAIEHWKSTIAELDEEKNLVKRYGKTLRYIHNRPSEALAVVGPEGYLYMCNVLVLMWKKRCETTKRKLKGIDIVALLWDRLLYIARSPNATPEVLKAVDLIKTCVNLPFPESVKNETASRDLSFKLSIKASNKDLAIPLNLTEFQLEHSGPYMERNFDSKPDDRVTFDPDAWQRKVLDTIDANNSLMVVAPTSAGKTFISFYAMKKILQANDDDVLVYVAPPRHCNSDRPSAWARRVKRIIFDEVHCIGQAEDGIVWEQLLLLAPCPIIALSATVGNAGEFHDWLAASQAQKGYKMELVVHNARIDQGEERNPRFFFTHPIAALLDINRGSLDDTKDFPVAKSLDPGSTLPEIISKADILSWEAGLKEVLQKWMVVPESPFSAEKRLKERTTIIPLLYDLNENDSLPAIAFNYDRAQCEEALKTVLAHLSAKETAWKESSKEWKQKLADYEEWKKAGLKAAKAKPKKDRPAAGNKDDRQGGSRDDNKNSKMQTAQANASIEVSPWESFDPEDPLEQFSFGDRTRLSRTEFAEMTDDLSSDKVDQWLVQSLKRGLGVHHAGMNRRYRQVVEILFRKGYLGVVMATGTLALGVNMPCKTVIFNGDSVDLTALNYRQAAGRAGRRGFDLLGNVVFADIAPNRAFEIMSLRLPDLRGHFPVSTTLILRLFGLLNGTKNSDFSTAAVNSLLSQSRLYLGGPEGGLAIKHHMRFSIEYLRRQHLLSEKGAPINYSSLVSHLYFTENAAFGFHALLKGGYFHRICGRINENPAAVLNQLVLVMSHLFGRQVIRTNDREYMEVIVRNSQSVIFLPRLPKAAERILVSHNRDTLNLFKDYVTSYASQHLSGSPDNVLPFTKTTVGAHEPTKAQVPFDRTPSPSIRSTFAALSGHTDESLSSVHDLCSTVRAGVFLEEATIPHVPVYPIDSDERLNAYIYDFFKHGDLVALTRDNRIKGGDVWFFLKDFSVVLATIVTSLTNYMRADADAEELGELDEGVAEDEVNFMPSQQTQRPAKASVAAAAAAPVTQTLPVRKKKKVADNWDDDDDEEAAQASGSSGDEETDSDGDMEDEENLPNVLKAFTQLKEEFDDKFFKIGA
ncbi:putative helicase like protein [Verticillium longisporum]|uniref:Putative helicase like protein n=2 Tax=Verticillium longisporum TaxID=100787 RepID=A0A8I2ZLS0_VERLO|nr:putative helicase like protein [Verticillium longisporum]